MKIKTAVIGVGHLGKNHVKWYKNINESDLIGVYDIDKKRAEEVADLYSIKAFSNIDNLIDKADAFSVVVSTASHYEVALKIIEKRKHCLIEKPVTANLDEAKTLIKKAKDNKIVLTVGHIERFNPAFRALKKYKVSPRFIESHRLTAFNPRGADVAVILDLMIHDIELCLNLIDSKVVHIESSAVAVISNTADIANTRLTFENGAVANLTASRISLSPMRKMRIFQPSAYYSLDLAKKQIDVYRLDEKANISDEILMKIPLGSTGKQIIYSKPEISGCDMLGEELSSFVNSIINKKDVEVLPDDAYKALEIALEIERLSTY